MVKSDTFKYAIYMAWFVLSIHGASLCSAISLLTYNLPQFFPNADGLAQLGFWMSIFLGCMSVLPLHQLLKGRSGVTDSTVGSGTD
jgi:hypothetical protein